MGEEEGSSLTQGVIVKTKPSFENWTEQVMVDEFFSESCDCKLGPRRVACSSVDSVV